MHSGPLIASPAGLLHIQQTAGNAAATAFVQRQPEGAVASGRPVLRFGSTGDDVKLLQMKLRHVRERRHDRSESDVARIDGIFGPLTKQDVIDFQSDTGLDADGIVGPQTWNALDELVPGTPDEGAERAADEREAAAAELVFAGQFDAALVIYEAGIAVSTTPEDTGKLSGNAGICHQQRGRFGFAVMFYEQALAGRLNQEGFRAKLLGYLIKARKGEFLDFVAPDPEPLPPGAEPGTTPGREGGGVTERQPAKSGDSGPAVDLFKGKLAHMMVGWKPTMPAGDTFDAPTVERTRQFQEACGLDQTGEADVATWHALDSFTRTNVPFSVVKPLNEAASDQRDVDPAVALPKLEAGRDEARALGLIEMVKLREAQIGVMHQRLSHFDDAITHYELYLDRVIPPPVQYGQVMDGIRKARLGDPNV
jgi:peptidoglycan hydrolase-like protein with peptidoglycan-binding domain